MKKVLFAIVALLFSVTAANANVTGQFTTEVQNREPVDVVDVLVKENRDNITFFTTITEMEGQKVKHVWKNGDNEIYSISFNVGANRWRVWSSVSIRHVNPGDKLTVDVMSGDNVIHSHSIMVE